MERKKTGRPSKGPRVQIALEVPPSLKAAAKANAEARGMSLLEYVAELLSRETGVPYKNQGELPLAG